MGKPNCISYFLKIVNIDSNSLTYMYNELIHISATNGINYIIINSCTSGNSIQFVIDIFSPVSHVVKKAIEHPMKTIEQGLQILFSGKGPESRIIIPLCGCIYDRTCIALTCICIKPCNRVVM